MTQTTAFKAHTMPVNRNWPHLACSKCGAPVEAKCGCGASHYLRAGVMPAVKTVTTTPKKYNGRKHTVLRRGGAGQRIPVPKGYEFLSDAIKAIIEMERSGVSREEAAKKVGLVEHSYAGGRDVVLLSERNDLPEREAALVRQAMEHLNRYCQVSGPDKLIKPIAQKVWGKKGHRLKSALLDKFRSSISYVSSTCIAVTDIDVPYLSGEDRQAIISELEEAETALVSIRKRINGSI